MQMSPTIPNTTPHLSTAEIEGKRSAILAPLTDILFEI